MDGQNNDSTTIIYSSIALLQERFRQLQRIKEMREEKQLLQMTAEAEQQPRWFFHPELIHPTMSVRGPPSFQLNCMSFDPCKTSLSKGLQSNNHGVHTSINSNETDIDTSLHL